MRILLCRFDLSIHTIHPLISIHLSTESNVMGTRKVMQSKWCSSVLVEESKWSEHIAGGVASTVTFHMGK